MAEKEYIDFTTRDKGIATIMVESYPEALPADRIERQKKENGEIGYIFRTLDKDVFHAFIDRLSQKAKKMKSKLEEGVKSN